MELENEYRATLKRAFIDKRADYIRMDGHEVRNKYLVDCWNWAIEQALLEVKEVELEQETFYKGYPTEKFKKSLKEGD